MTKVKFPAISFPAFKFTKGQLLNVNLLGVGFVIPPWDITFWEALQLTREHTLFNTDDIASAIVFPLEQIAEAVWALFKSTLDKMAADYYERHSEEKK